MESARKRLRFSPPPHTSNSKEGIFTSQQSESLYAYHGHPGEWFNPWRKQIHHPSRYYFIKIFHPTQFLNSKSSATSIPRVSNNAGYSPQQHGTPSFTWVGHSTFLIEDGGTTILTDPHFGPRSFWHKRLHPPGVSLMTIPPNAISVLSHNHYDHMDDWTIKRLPKTITRFVPMGLAKWFRKRGRNAVELDWWQSAQSDHWKLTCLPAQHWSNRFCMRRNRTLWCSWLLESDSFRFFFAGDSGYFDGFSEYSRRFGPIDVAMLPIGGYEPRSLLQYSHMNPAEACRSFQDLRARWMLPMHWGTFKLTSEPVGDPARMLIRALRNADQSPNPVKLMAIGEKWEMPAYGE